MSDNTENPGKTMADQMQTATQRGMQTAQDVGRRATEAGMAEFTRMFSDMKFPAVPDMEAFLAAHRRNMEALSAANRVALEGAQTVAKRHMEILQQTMLSSDTKVRGLRRRIGSRVRSGTAQSGHSLVRSR